MSERHDVRGLCKLIVSVIIVFIAGALWQLLKTHQISLDLVDGGLDALKGFLIASIIVLAVSTFTNALFALLYPSEPMVQRIVAEMHARKLPYRQENDWEGFEYLRRLTNDSNASADDRVRAALFLGSYEPALGSEFYRRTRLRNALNEAVIRYADEMRGTA